MPPRDTSARPGGESPAVGTARLHGRVVAAENGEPLRRAIITAQPNRPPEMRRGGVYVAPRQLAARTDDDGRYVIADVPAGDYTLNARRSGYAGQGYGQLRPNTPARRVSVADGASVGPLDFSLVRGGVITGRVMDEEGEPAERVQVRLVRQLRMGGRTRMVNISVGDSTDDQGQYRLFGVPAGEYMVVAEPTDHRMFFMGGPSVQGASTDTIATYGPGTANPAEAQKVQVQAGVETAMDIQLVAARIATVSGQVVSSKGEPLVGAHVRLLSAEGNESMGMGRGGQVRGDGRFEIAAVPPGAYNATVMAPMRDGPDRMEPSDMEGAMEPLTVEGEDVSLTIRTTRGSTAKGRIVLEGADPTVLATRELYVHSMPAGEFMNVFIGPPGRGLVKPDLTFEVVGLRGTQVLHVPLLPEGWWVKDVRLAGQSIFDGHDFGSGRSFSGVDVVVSGRPTGLTGTVSGPTGASAGDYAVVLFPTDEERWERNGPAQMGGRAVRPGLDGLFKLPGLRPGDYYVLAVPAEQADMQALADPEQLRALAARARTVEVKDGEMLPLTLTLVER